MFIIENILESEPTTNRKIKALCDYHLKNDENSFKILAVESVYSSLNSRQFLKYANDNANKVLYTTAFEGIKIPEYFYQIIECDHQTKCNYHFSTASLIEKSNDQLRNTDLLIIDKVQFFKNTIYNYLYELIEHTGTSTNIILIGTPSAKKKLSTTKNHGLPEFNGRIYTWLKL